MALYRTDLRDIFFNLFELLEVHKLAGAKDSDLKDIIREFDKYTANEVFPTRKDSDIPGAKLINGNVVVPDSFKKANDQFYQNGWMGLGYPEELGGMPAPQSIATTCTAIATGANVAFSMYYGLSKAALNVIIMKGSEAQKSLYISKMMSGEWGGTMCLTEANAGSDVGALKTVATPIGNGKYKIKGIKIFISSGESDLYKNNIHLVLARTPGAPEGTKGLSLFIVPRFKIDSGKSNDVTCTKIEEKMGLHGSSTCELAFGQNDNCEGELIGKELEGMANMFIMMNEARLLCGLQGESQANMVYELTQQYAQERSQFGTEIYNHPDVKRMLLKMRSMSRGLRSLMLYTADLLDREHAGEKDASELVALLTPICKSFGSDEGFNVCVEAIQVHGGYGYCSEYGIEQFARDSKIATIYEGTNGIQAIDFVMRKILKDQGNAITKLGKRMEETLKILDPTKLKEEMTLFAELLKETQKIVSYLGTLAINKDQQALLFNSTDFLNYCGNLVIAWLQLRSANLALTMIKSTSGDEQKFYESKISDCKAFCSLYLTRNLGIARNILRHGKEVAGVVI